VLMATVGDKMGLKNSKNVKTQYQRVTDGWTDGQTDILPRHSSQYAYASHGKNSTRHCYT